MTSDARARPARIAVVAGEVVLVVAAATGAVALLRGSGSASGLEVLYLLAVLAIAIRRGQVAALVTAVLSVLTVNYLFIPPRHELDIAHSRDVIDLIVLMVAALVVGRLAATARQRTAEAEDRARAARAREREAKLLAEVASAILGAGDLALQLDGVGSRIARATGAARARVALHSVPEPAGWWFAQPLHTNTRSAWLYADRGDWRLEDMERICEPLARIVDVAVEQERVAEAAAEAEAALRADAARTAVLHAISHDLRSPLTAIATAGAALRREVSPKERSEMLDVIDHQSHRLARLVADLLDVSKIEAGAVAPHPDWCDLHDVVASALAQLRSDHPVELELATDLPLIRADAAQLERVFVNLIDNAIKFSPRDAPVRVSGGTAGGRVTVRVVNKGQGIPAGERSRVFEPFFRGRGARGGEGSGLGLAICRGFVEANGGQIVMASDRDRGTSFAVTFPVAPAPAEDPGAVLAGPEPR